MQCYTKVVSQLIGNNINFLCIFKQSLKHIKNIFDEYDFGSDFTFKKFKKFVLCVGTINMDI
jgi:hypothetical protein